MEGGDDGQAVHGKPKGLVLIGEEGIVIVTELG
jgi:hypothetical protein